MWNEKSSVNKVEFFIDFFPNFRVRPFNIYQENKYGVRKIDIFQEDVQKNGKWSVERVVYLNGGDRVYIQLSMALQQYISPAEQIHLFGLFEIWNTFYKKLCVS